MPSFRNLRASPHLASDSLAECGTMSIVCNFRTFQHKMESTVFDVSACMQKVKKRRSNSRYARQLTGGSWEKSKSLLKCAEMSFYTNFPFFHQLPFYLYSKIKRSCFILQTASRSVFIQICFFFLPCHYFVYSSWIYCSVLRDVTLSLPPLLFSLFMNLCQGQPFCSVTLSIESSQHRVSMLLADGNSMFFLLPRLQHCSKPFIEHFWFCLLSSSQPTEPIDEHLGEGLLSSKWGGA